MTTAADALERRYRLLLRCYPRTWRREHEDDLIGVLLDRAEAEERVRVDAGVVVDLVGHGLESRLDALLRWLPERLRRQVASAALVAAGSLSLLLVTGEVIGARSRLPADTTATESRYLSSGPFLTTGVGLYVAVLVAALLVLIARPGLARLLLLAGSAYALWMACATAAGAHHLPRLPLLVMCAGLGLLASLTTLELGRLARRRLLRSGAGFVGAVASGLLLTRPLLGWSVGTMTTSGNVALAALAFVLSVVSGATILLAAVRARRSPGWPSALAVAAFPVVVFCSMVSVVVNPVHLESRALIPAAYLAVVAAVATTVRLRRRLATTR